MKQELRNLITTRMTREELERALSNSSSVVKLACGVGNNCAIAVMLDAHDQIRKHPNYRHEVKRLYKQAIELFYQRERQLLYGTNIRFFHVADMPPEIRKKYGNITDGQYFEFWQGLGSRAYTESHPLLTSLHNKYRLSLVAHGIDHADAIAWPMVAQACLELADNLHATALTQCSEQHRLPIKLLREIFYQFSIHPVVGVWSKALELTEPKLTFKLSQTEDRNIELGIRQLYEKWSDPKMLYESAITTTENFDDIFRTKGENKKARREIAELLKETVN